MILDKTLSIPSYIMFQEFDSEGILLDIRNQEHFGLDPISSLFLKSIQNKLCVKKACALILEEYDVESEQLYKDLNKLINTLLEHELIEVS
ncbi:MAG: hypothetical protein COA44_06360 [Arcobacter sp.]|nr:MAG: hypothetical protein COA44_06360 [Arcobacter sp.]